MNRGVRSGRANGSSRRKNAHNGAVSEREVKEITSRLATVYQSPKNKVFYGIVTLNINSKLFLFSIIEMLTA